MPLDSLIEQLKSPVTGEQIEAARELGRSQSPEAFTPLVEALRDPNREVRKVAVEALGLLGDLRAVEPLIELYNDEELGELEEDWQLPSPIEQVLVSFGSPAVETLLQYVDNWLVMAVLGQIRDVRAFEPLMRIVEIPPHSLYDRQCAIAALGCLKDPRAFDTIASYVRHQTSGVTAISALGALGDPRAIPILEDILYHPVIYGLEYAASSLCHLGTDEALDALIKFAQREPTRNRLTALYVLTYSKHPKVVKFFTELLRTSTDEEEWNYSAIFFLQHGQIEVLEELKKIVPEPVAHVIHCYLQRFKGSTASPESHSS